MENIGGDAPFGGDYGGALGLDDFFPNRQTDRIMAFDVVLEENTSVLYEFDPSAIRNTNIPNSVIENIRVRKVALFEGMDEFGRLQPLLGTAEPATDYQENRNYSKTGGKIKNPCVLVFDPVSCKYEKHIGSNRKKYSRRR